MAHTPEELDQISHDQLPEDRLVYQERPRSHRIGAWILILVVLLAFLGTCYWLAFYGRA